MQKNALKFIKKNSHDFVLLSAVLKVVNLSRRACLSIAIAIYYIYIKQKTS